VLLLLPILAAIALLLGVGLAIGTLGHRGGRRRRALADAANLRVLPGRGGDAQRALTTTTHALRDALEQLADNGQALLGLDEYIDIGARRPLWRRLSDAGYIRRAHGLRAQVRAWCDQTRELPEELRPLAQTARSEALQLDHHLARELSDAEQLAAVHSAVTSTVTALAELAGELASYNPRTYR